MKSVNEEIETAAALGRHILREKGLEVLNGEVPTPYQSGIAAIHSREDVAAMMYLMARVMQRQQTIQRWLYFVVFLLLCVLTNQK